VLDHEILTLEPGEIPSRSVDRGSQSYRLFIGLTGEVGCTLLAVKPRMYHRQGNFTRLYSRQGNFTSFATRVYRQHSNPVCTATIVQSIKKKTQIEKSNLFPLQFEFERSFSARTREA
jgi:hypothetical protein